MAGILSIGIGLIAVFWPFVHHEIRSVVIDGKKSEEFFLSFFKDFRFGMDRHGYAFAYATSAGVWFGIPIFGMGLKFSSYEEMGSVRKIDGFVYQYSLSLRSGKKILFSFRSKNEQERFFAILTEHGIQGQTA